MKRLMIVAALVFAYFPAAALAQEDARTVVDFSGEIVDQDAVAVSGVLPLEFRIFSDEKSRRPLAVERHFIAVVDGAYAVTLGEDSAISAKGTRLVVAVYLDGRELTRQEVAVGKQLVRKASRVVETPRAGDAAQDGAFRLECPAGYVVTGVEGALKDGVNSLRAVCTQAVRL